MVENIAMVLIVGKFIMIAFLEKRCLIFIYDTYLKLHITLNSQKKLANFKYMIPFLLILKQSFFISFMKSAFYSLSIESLHSDLFCERL